MWETKNRADRQSNGEHFTILGKDVTFKGIVHFEGTVQIDNHFEGEIHSKGTIVVGEHAVIRGMITAGTLISGGKINGNITATDKVQLLKSGVLIGDVCVPCFSVEEGAYFKGVTDMGTHPWIEEPIPSAEVVPELTTRRHSPRPLLLKSDTEQ